MKQFLFCMSLLLVSVSAVAQDSFACRAQRYIAQYSCYAISEQKRCGIPASVTLAQGILETEAGKSELVYKGNNHFGIKCKNDYDGPKMYHDDDQPGECFRMYKCAEDSYKDHSDYLKRNKRYEPLFRNRMTDYFSWSRDLKKCGYATNPEYADRLIKIIEDFNLQEYTLKALDKSKQVKTMPVPEPPVKMDTPKQTAILPVHAPKCKTFPIVLLPKQTDTLPVNAPKINPVAAAPPPVELAAAPPADTVKKVIPPTVIDSPKKVVATAPVKPDAPPVVIPPVVQATAVAVTAPVTDTPLTQPNVIAHPIVTTDVKFDTGREMEVNGLHAFYAEKGEMLLQYAVKYNIRYPKLLEINDLPDAPLTEHTLIYLEKKHNEGTHAKHTVKEGETLFMIAQQEGMVLRRLMTLNMLDPNDEPAIGTVLELQSGAVRKPGLRATPPTDLKTSPNNSFVQPTPPDAFVTVTHPAPVDTATHTVQKEVNRDTYVTTIHTTPDSGSKAETLPVKKDAVALDKDGLPPAALDTLLFGADTVKDELAMLKAKLDKVVYPDNNPIKKENSTTSTPIVLTPITDEPKNKNKKSVKEKAVAKNSNYHTVVKGENLSKIARDNHVTVKEILKLNDIDPDALHLGQKLRIR